MSFSFFFYLGYVCIGISVRWNCICNTNTHKKILHSFLLYHTFSTGSVYLPVTPTVFLTHPCYYLLLLPSFLPIARYYLSILPYFWPTPSRYHLSLQPYFWPILTLPTVTPAVFFYPSPYVTTCHSSRISIPSPRYHLSLLPYFCHVIHHHIL